MGRSYHVKYTDGLERKIWQTIKSLNENPTAGKNTKYEPAREKNIKDSIRQGRLLSAYMLLMDEISNYITVENLGITIREDDKQIGNSWTPAMDGWRDTNHRQRKEKTAANAGYHIQYDITIPYRICTIN